jgi:DNA mismatch repair protein MutL
VFDLVYHAALSALQGEERTSAAPEAKPAAPELRPAVRPDFYQSMTSGQFRAQGYRAEGRKASNPTSFDRGEVRSVSNGPTLRSWEEPYQTRLDLTSGAKPSPIRPNSTQKSKKSTDFSHEAVENPVQNVENIASGDFRLIGEALKLYILVERGGELLLIDKHAAHERMIFDRLKAQDRHVMAQTLLESVTLHLNGAERELLEENAALLAELGFELEPFGDEDYILRAVPADMASSDARAAVEEILEKLASGQACDAQSARDEILHTVACKAAIKAGWDNDPAELRRVAEAVLSGRVKYCPHGRPVSATLTRRELDKLFKRIV